MRWQASWMLQNSDLETFAAVHACKRAKQATTQVLRKASSSIKQERSEWSDDRCCDWCHSLPASLSVRQKFEFSNQITTPAAHHCKTCLCAPSQLEDGQDSSSPPFFDTRPYWPRKHDVQGTFKAKSLHETTTWISYSCDIEIIAKRRWWEPELGKLGKLLRSCRDSFGFLTLHLSLRSALSFEQVTWPVKHRFIESCLIFGICKQGLAQTQFFAVTDSHQSETDTIYLASFGKRSFEEHLKWNRDDKLSQMLWKRTPAQKVVL